MNGPGYIERRWCVKCKVWVEKGRAPETDADWYTLTLAGADVSRRAKKKRR